MVKTVILDLKGRRNCLNVYICYFARCRIEYKGFTSSRRQTLVDSFSNDTVLYSLQFGHVLLVNCKDVRSRTPLACVFWAFGEFSEL